MQCEQQEHPPTAALGWGPGSGYPAPGAGTGLWDAAPMGVMLRTRAWHCQLGPGAAGHPAASKGVLDPLMS